MHSCLLDPTMNSTNCAPASIPDPHQDQSWPKPNQTDPIYAIKIPSRGFQKGATSCSLMAKHEQINSSKTLIPSSKSHLVFIKRIRKKYLVSTQSVGSFSPRIDHNKVVITASTKEHCSVNIYLREMKVQ